jgi:H+-transporting ATPase
MLICGAVIRRGETVGQVIATGEQTKFGRTAELVRTATLESSQQRTVLPIITATKWQGAS